MNPVHKKVPVLLHHGKPLAESLLLLEYIDETWKENPLLPQDPYERAVARFWAKFADEKCILGAWGAWWAEEAEEKEQAVEAAKQSLAHLEKQLEGKKFFNGERVGFLDLAMGWITLWLDTMEEVGGMKILQPECFPHLHEWAHNFSQVPAIKECLPSREMLLDYLHALRPTSVPCLPTSEHA